MDKVINFDIPRLLPYHRHCEYLHLSQNLRIRRAQCTPRRAFVRALASQWRLQGLSPSQEQDCPPAGHSAGEGGAENKNND